MLEIRSKVFQLFAYVFHSPCNDYCRCSQMLHFITIGIFNVLCLVLKLNVVNGHTLVFWHFFASFKMLRLIFLSTVKRTFHSLFRSNFESNQKNVFVQCAFFPFGELYYWIWNGCTLSGCFIATLLISKRAMRSIHNEIGKKWEQKNERSVKQLPKYNNNTGNPPRDMWT